MNYYCYTKKLKEQKHKYILTNAVPLVALKLARVDVAPCLEREHAVALPQAVDKLGREGIEESKGEKESPTS